jgi:transporter family-2 protein
MPTLPWPYFFAGLFGVILYFSFAYTLPRIGVGMTSALLILAQMAIGLLIDHNGWMGAPVTPISLSRLAGVGAILLGAILFRVSKVARIESAPCAQLPNTKLFSNP